MDPLTNKEIVKNRETRRLSMLPGTGEMGMEASTEKISVKNRETHLLSLSPRLVRDLSTLSSVRKQLRARDV